MSEFDTKNAPTCLKEKMLISDKDGSLETSDEYEQIPHRPELSEVGEASIFLQNRQN